MAILICYIKVLLITVTAPRLYTSALVFLFQDQSLKTQKSQLGCSWENQPRHQ